METDELSSCPVCFEPYKNVGDGVPRILPCHCTLCHKCIGKLLKGKTVVCPQDRQAHAAVNGITSFPQNKYILIYLKKQLRDNQVENGLCKKHKEEEKWFCRAEQCRRPICETCYDKFHNMHDVVDLGNEIKEKQKSLLTKVDAQMKNLIACKEKLNDTKQEICKNYEKNMAKLSRKKNEQCEILDGRLAVLNSHVSFLKETKAASKIPMTYNYMTERAQKLEDMTSASHQQLKTPIHYDYSEVIDTDNCLDITRELSGIGVKKVVHITNVSYKSVMSVQALPNNTFTLLRKVHVTPATYTGWVAHKLQAVLGLVKPTSEDKWKGKLMQYDMRGKAIHNTFCSVFEAVPNLRIGGRDVLAVYTGNQIEYRNVHNVEESVHRATKLYDSFLQSMCFVNQSTLLIRSLDTFYSLDHKKWPPENRVIPIYLPHNEQGMCCLKCGSKTLVIIAAGYDGVFAYCFQSGALEWCAKDAVGDNSDESFLTDVATDGNNKIFVCDEGNACVHVFSPDGAYVGDLIRKEERGLGLPFKISWNDRNKSLLVAHKKDEVVHVSSVKVSL